MSVQEFVDAFKAGKKLDKNVDVVCRIFKYPAGGEIPHDIHLTIIIEPETGKSKPFVFFAAPDGAQMILNNGSDKVFDSLIMLGVSAGKIEDTLLKKGLRYALVVCSSQLSFPAEFDSLLDHFAEAEPTIAEYVEKYRERVKSEPKFYETDEFKKRFQSPHALECCSIETDLDMFLTPKRFLERTDRSFLEFRAVLWLWGSANHLFTGQGHTVDAQSGKRGVGECLLPNLTLGELVTKHGAVILPLDVKLPGGGEEEQEDDNRKEPVPNVKEGCCC